MEIYSLSRKARFLVLYNIVVSVLLLTTVFYNNYPGKIYSYITSKAFHSSYNYNSNTQFKEQEDYCKLYKKPANVVMLGTSLTYKMNWNELLERNDVANRGVVGDVMGGLIDRLKLVLPLKPKVCFIEGGINDLQRNVDIKQICSNITLLIDSLKKQHVVPVLSLVICVSKNYDDYTALNKKIETINLQYREIAEREGIEVIDLNSDISPGNLLRDDLAEEDGVHLKSAAYLPWKHRVEEVLARLKI